MRAYSGGHGRAGRDLGDLGDLDARQRGRAPGWAGALLELQRAAGNRAVAGMVNAHGAQAGHRGHGAQGWQGGHGGHPVVVQRCRSLLCCFGLCQDRGNKGDAGERQRLLLPEAVLVRDDLPEPGQAWQATQGWVREPNLLAGRYEVYLRHADRKIGAVAVLPGGSPEVVANSSLSYTTTDRAVAFTDVGSTPPLAGLGGIVFARLQALAAGRRLVPKGPIAGALRFYERTGIAGITLDPTARRRVDDHLANTASERVKARAALEDPAVREELTRIQEQIRRIENDELRKRRITIAV